VARDPDDPIKAAIRRARASSAQTEDPIKAAIRRARGEKEERGVLSNLARGGALGLAETGYSLAGAGTWLGEKAGGAFGIEGLESASRRGSESIARQRREAQEFYDPRGASGTVGRVGGRIVGEVATAAATAPRLAAAASKLLPQAPRITGALSRLGPRTEAAIRAGAADLPISALQSAAAMGEGQEGGFVLPGYLGTLTEQTLFSGAAGALMPGSVVRRRQAEAEAAAPPPPTPPPLPPRVEAVDPAELRRLEFERRRQMMADLERSNALAAARREELRVVPSGDRLPAPRPAEPAPRGLDIEPELPEPSLRDLLVPGPARRIEATRPPRLRSAMEIVLEREELNRIAREREGRIRPDDLNLPAPETPQGLIERPTFIGGRGSDQFEAIRRVDSPEADLFNQATATPPVGSMAPVEDVVPEVPRARSTARPVVQEEAPAVGVREQLNIGGEALEPPRDVRVSSPGAAAPARSATGDVFPTEYVLIEADDLLASNNPYSFMPEPDYPAGVQMRGRQYETRPSQEIVFDQASRLDPERALDPTNMMDNGPPVVTVNGRAVAGNSRSMALRLAARQFPAKYEAYREALRASAQRFGISADEISAMAQPVLVRRLTEDVTVDQMREINRLSDISGMKTKRPVDVAMEKANLLRGDEGLMKYLEDNMDLEETMNSFMLKPEGRRFLDLLAERGIINQSELPSLLTDSGNVGEWGRDVARQMVMASALDQFDDIPPGILKKLETATPALAMMRGSEGDISGLIQDAAKAIRRASDSGITLDDLASQASMFDDSGIADEVLEMAKYLRDNSQRKIAQDIRKYAANVMSNRREGPGMFAGMEGVVETPAEAARKIGLPIGRGGFAVRELTESLGGAAVGAAAGGAVGGEEGAVAGGIAGAIGTPMAGRAFRSRALAPTVDEAADALRAAPDNADLTDEQVRRIAEYVADSKREIADFKHLSPYERDVMDGRVGIPKDEPLFNSSLYSVDPTGGVLARREEAFLESQGMQKVRVPDAVVDRISRELDIDVKRGSASRMTTPRFVALARRIYEDRAFIARMEELAQGATSPEVKSAYDEAIEGAYKRLLNYDKEFNAAGSEAGRQLRILREVSKMMGGTSQAYLRAAKRYLGVRELNEGTQDAIVRIYNQNADQATRDAELARYLQGLKKSTVGEAIADVARWGLLTAPASMMRNLTGGVEVAALGLIETPIASAIDRITSSSGGLNRTVIADPMVTKSWFRGARGGLEAFEKFRERYMGGGIDPENPMDVLNQRRVNYESVIGDGRWADALRPGARALQFGADAIYGTLAATDAVFYKGFLNASLKQRAILRAMNEGLTPRTPEFIEAVMKYSDPDNMRPVDVIMAQVEALDATLKTPTIAQDVLRYVKRSKPGAGNVLDFIVPFANTPTNIIRKAMERVPLIGAAVSEGQVSTIRKKLQQMKDAGIDISDTDIASEVRRYRIKGTASQISGAGLIMSGYAMYKSGVLTGDFAFSIGRELPEREEARRRDLTGQGALSLKVGDTSYSIGAGFGIMGPLLAIGAALAAADEYDPGSSVTQRVGLATKSAGKTALEIPVVSSFADIQSLLQTGGMTGTEYAARQTGRLIPASSLMRGVARATDSEVGMRSPEGFTEAIMQDIPGLRQRIAPRVNPLGEPYPAAGGANILINPFSPKRTLSGPLYDALEQAQFYPAPADRLKDETRRDYSGRRQAEGANERALLQGLVSGDDGAWSFVSDNAYQDFLETQDWRELLASALRGQRTAVSRERGAVVR
jgi:hypothetical protein